MKRANLVVGNWKMNGSLADNSVLLDELARFVPPEGTTVAVCVPYLYLHQTSEILEGSWFRWGAQNVSEHDFGAYTGEVSAAMLVDFSVTYGIVGHSERRSLYFETKELVGLKAKVLIEKGITPIICVGETLEDRKNERTFEVVQSQLQSVVEVIGAKGLSSSVLAYEPVWAIGTGLTASPEQAQEVHKFLRNQISLLDSAISEKIEIIYGGSVKPENAKEIFLQTDVDGGLIGGASLSASNFLDICRQN